MEVIPGVITSDFNRNFWINCQTDADTNRVVYASLILVYLVTIYYMFFFSYWKVW